MHCHFALNRCHNSFESIGTLFICLQECNIYLFPSATVSETATQSHETRVPACQSNALNTVVKFMVKQTANTTKKDCGAIANRNRLKIPPR